MTRLVSLALLLLVTHPLTVADRGDRACPRADGARLDFAPVGATLSSACARSDSALPLLGGTHRPDARRATRRRSAHHGRGAPGAERRLFRRFRSPWRTSRSACASVEPRRRLDEPRDQAIDVAVRPSSACTSRRSTPSAHDLRRGAAPAASSRKRAVLRGGRATVPDSAGGTRVAQLSRDCPPEGSPATFPMTLSSRPRRPIRARDVQDTRSEPRIDDDSAACPARSVAAEDPRHDTRRRWVRRRDRHHHRQRRVRPAEADVAHTGRRLVPIPIPRSTSRSSDATSTTRSRPLAGISGRLCEAFAGDAAGRLATRGGRAASAGAPARPSSCASRQDGARGAARRTASISRSTPASERERRRADGARRHGGARAVAHGRDGRSSIRRDAVDAGRARARTPNPCSPS